ncbi:MAG: MlaC/ttg2D family ABC transporter substrate-binding protein [Alkalilacustris sp.]
MTSNLISRRNALTAGLAAVAAIGLPTTARATSLYDARSLVDAVAAELTAIVNSGGTTDQMIARFDGVFSRFADMPVIARSVLGPAARQASPQQLARFTDAYRGYLARKYGRMLFGGYSGGEISVTGAATSGTVHSVQSVANMQRRGGGRERLDVVWQVSTRSPEARFFNMIIDGVNFFAIEREEVPALLDARRGNLDRLIADLPGLG